MNKKFILLAPVIVLALASTIFLTSTLASKNDQVSATSNACLPTTLDSVTFKYPIKQPVMDQILTGYKLQAVDQNAADVFMWYSDHSLCQVHGLPDELYRGSILVIAAYNPNMGDSATEAQKELNNLKGSTAKLQMIDVNGYKGIGWEPFQGADVVKLNGTVLDSQPIPMPGRVEFFNDHDKTWYSVSGMRSMSELLQIAMTIPK